MRILSHYFVTRFLGLFSMVLATAFLVLATIELVLNIDDVSAFASGAEGPSATAQTLRYLGIRLTSYYLADVLPIASFIAVFLTLAISGRAMELTAAEAGGIPPLRILLPIVATALILSLGAGVLHETVVLRADRIWSGKGLGSSDGLDFGREAFWYHRGPFVTNVGRADPEARTLFDVEIFERGHQGRIVRIVRAGRVTILEDGLWQMDSAHVWSFDPLDVEREPRVERGVPIVIDLDSATSDALLRAEPALLPLPDLARYLAALPSETSSTVRHIRSRYHERLASPWLVVVFAWLAIPFALRVDERGRIAGPAIAAVATLALYFVVESAGRILAQEALIPVGITPWTTMAFFSVAAAFGLLLRPR